MALHLLNPDKTCYLRPNLMSYRASDQSLPLELKEHWVWANEGRGFGWIRRIHCRERRHDDRSSRLLSLISVKGCPSGWSASWAIEQERELIIAGVSSCWRLARLHRQLTLSPNYLLTSFPFQSISSFLNILFTSLKDTATSHHINSSNHHWSLQPHDEPRFLALPALQRTADASGTGT